MEGLVSLAPLILIFAVFWFLLIRPQRNRQREMAQLQASVSVGQEIMTTSGLYGRIVAVDGDVITLEHGPGTTTRWSRGAIGRVVSGSAGDREDLGGPAEPGDDHIPPR